MQCLFLDYNGRFEEEDEEEGLCNNKSQKNNRESFDLLKHHPNAIFTLSWSQSYKNEVLKGQS